MAQSLSKPRYRLKKSMSIFLGMIRRSWSGISASQVFSPDHPDREIEPQDHGTQGENSPGTQARRIEAEGDGVPSRFKKHPLVGVVRPVKTAWFPVHADGPARIMADRENEHARCGCRHLGLHPVLVRGDTPDPYPSLLPAHRQVVRWFLLQQDGPEKSLSGSAIRPRALSGSCSTR